MADAIVSFDGDLPNIRLRHHAHAFVRATERIIELGQKENPGDPIEVWVAKWYQSNA